MAAAICVSNLKEKRKTMEVNVFLEREVFFVEQRETSPTPLSPQMRTGVLDRLSAGQGLGVGLHALEPTLFPSREPGAQREGTAYPGHVRDSAAGSGRVALCPCPSSGWRGPRPAPGTCLSQMPQSGSVSGTCVTAFCISIKS